MSDAENSGEKIGEFLLKIGAITEDQIKEILEKQKSSDKMFGELAIELGYIDDQALKKYLDSKK